MSTQYWLMKSEPNVYSIDDLKREGRTHWEGVRNYQARNFMRDQMNLNDRVLFYHSNCNPPGIVGLATVSKLAYPDFFAWDSSSPYFDPKASPEKPIWMMVDVDYEAHFSKIISLEQLKNEAALAGMLVAKKGMRLSIQPVTQAHFDHVLEMAKH
ncbi:MAG: EVE domain-containing protein [Actinobacteria bacterium]|nr:EVE domain-containing protein [Actinomycetota bacterium]